MNPMQSPNTGVGRALCPEGREQLPELPASNKEALRWYRATMEERQCRVDGQLGVVEKVYQRRRQVAGVFGCKIILDSGKVIYRDVVDVTTF